MHHGLVSGTLDRAAGALEAGACVVIPTDTVYGVAAHLERPRGIDRLFALKGRDRTKPLAVLAADEAQAIELLDLDRLAHDDAARARSLMKLGWPGALTVVGPRAEKWQHVDLGGDASFIGVRVPASKTVRTLAFRVGPLVTTSANRSGEPTPHDAFAAARALAGEVAEVLDGGPGGSLASTVIDVSESPFRVVRQGAFVMEDTGA